MATSADKGFSASWAKSVPLEMSCQKVLEPGLGLTYVLINVTFMTKQEGLHERSIQVQGALGFGMP